MKQKKILLAILVLVMLTALSGCKKNESAFTIGTWNENVFENTWLNMKFEIPKDWSLATDEEIAQLMDLGAEAIDLEGSGSDLLKKVAEIKNVYGFLAYSPDSTSNIQLVYENLALTLGGTKYTENDYIESVTNLMLNNSAIEYTVEDQSTVQIAGRDFELLRLSIYEGAYYQDFYCHKVDNYMVNIVASYLADNQEDMKDILSKITVFDK
ncbi:hypothetical protein acsn021_44910 [Anaerocolumna cellulosilytica]|uniref:Uncharacterized protein n=1 Tax=Anaerocolumna cellulosilytica TaxID=433286 RepID=A0A6S6RCG4_9FIRM|nr:hypothetical protein [Anaerocolumna cellulosilytica]MBB5195911.1 hypothetical protein [Anaerocolumna cellulosilytica]BCJ96922.1 hypothetical protein acsn021_44910 [Anaerocolumna cellulosilytica]